MVGRLVNGKLFWQFRADLSLGPQIGDKGTGGWRKGDRPSGDDRTGRVGMTGQVEGECGLLCQWWAVLSMAGLFANGGRFCQWWEVLSMAS